MAVLKTRKAFNPDAPPKQTEKDLAALIILYLEDMGWDVYQEVQLFHYGMRADIVAVRDKITWVIETKMGMGLDVIQQAWRWHTFANYVSVAIPSKLRTRTLPFGEHVCRNFGIGVLECDFNRTFHSGISENVKPALFRKPYKKLREILRDEHKTFAPAGNSDGKFWSPFKQTCERLVKVVTKTPGITMKELVEKTDHHYASDSTAKGSIVRWIREDKIKELRVDDTVRPMRVYLDDRPR